ncbi:alpha-methylacyl-CoA racemase [Jatrophihabitans endophyticus]|uniref:Alpha-methylacyl-CoA racemase n=1 Tax=Jatrophihabitans endophyticus TaxID=1206085 RepID=A0A1M5D388_9ACTN|nr:CaiB/BaiF CoA-transferase family protein [Jatrophihabitans endophyticus]SHF61441.1 alpha-methylacyl-CoA racemase [Jatrophihabitans endophyticus]
MPGPLESVRVVELPAIGPVPMAAMLLADLGAEVIRIDKLGRDDSLAGVMNASPMGRGRRSLGLDLRRPGAAEVLLRLVERSDALIEGFRPGVAERLGIGPDDALARNPRLVYGRMTGWGQYGPLAATAGHDLTYLAVTGLLHGIGPADGPPVPPVNYVADFGGGSMFLVSGVLAALLHARTSGAGQVIDAAMTEGASYLGSMTRAMVSMGGWQDRREANLLDGGSPNYRCYETSDGKWLAVGPLEPQFWATLVTTLGREVEGTPGPYDPAQWDACRQWLTETFLTRTRDEWAELFAPLDACVAPVLTLAEALEHPHNVARGSYTEVSGAPMPGPAPSFSRTPGAAGTVPRSGADSAAVLAELGYSDTALAELRDAGAIG